MGAKGSKLTPKDALLAAAENGDVKMASKALKKGAEVDASVMSSGDTALIVACKNGQEEIVELLLESGADAMKTDKRGWTPLFTAAGKGHAGIVRRLVAAGADVDAESGNSTPLITAAIHGHTEVVAFLLEEGKADVNKRVTGPTLASCAACSGVVDVMRMILDAGAPLQQDPDASHPDDIPLYHAILHGHLDMVRFLVEEQGVPLDAVGTRAPLHLAASSAAAEVVQFFVEEHGIDVDSQDGGETALVAATKRACADMDDRMNAMMASQFGHTKEAFMRVIVYLVGQGAATKDAQFVSRRLGHPDVTALLNAS